MGGGRRGRGQRHGTLLEVTDIHAHGLESTGVYTYARTFQMIHFKHIQFILCQLDLNKNNKSEGNVKSGLSLSGVITDDLYFLLYAFLHFTQVKSIISKIFSLYSVQTFS